MALRKFKTTTVLGPSTRGLKTGNTEVTAPGDTIALTSSDGSIVFTADPTKGSIDIKTGTGGGTQGPPGDSATVEIGSVVTGDPGTPVSIVNVGTATHAILNFVVPKGDQGEQGISLRVYRKMLTQFEVDQRFISLPADPYDTSKVTVDLAGCGRQTVGLDYLLTGQIISWNGLGLEHLLEAGLVLEIGY